MQEIYEIVIKSLADEAKRINEYELNDIISYSLNKDNYSINGLVELGGYIIKRTSESDSSLESSNYKKLYDFYETWAIIMNTSKDQQINLDLSLYKTTSPQGMNKNILTKNIASLYYNQILSFPWKKYYHEDSKIIFEKLKNYSSNSQIYKIQKDTTHIEPFKFKSTNPLVHTYFIDPITNKKGYLAFVRKDEDYQIDVITDLYQEKARLSAQKQNNLSSLQLWKDENFIREILYKTITKYNKITSETVRETIYENTQECTQFSSILTLSIIKQFNSKKVLDFSAGWGDRLIGSLASGVEKYKGFDPNINLKEGHDRIIQELDQNQSDVSIEYLPFEQSDIGEVKEYDLVFTSPPFFDLEVYVKDDVSNQVRTGECNCSCNQSINNYKSFDEWLVKFLFASLRKCWNVLINNGIMVIHIADIPNHKICEPMVLYVINNLEGSKYLGIINSISHSGKPRSLWCFKKM